MKIELLCRYRNENISEEDNALMKSELLIKGEEFDETEFFKKNGIEEYEYGLFVFDMKDVKAFNAIDMKHTCIRFYQGDLFVFRVNYDFFLSIYEKFFGAVESYGSEEAMVQVEAELEKAANNQK